MKNILLTILLILCNAWRAEAQPESYTFDKFHTAVTWKASHFGFSYPSGKFTDISGLVIIDEQNMAASSIDAKIAIKSLETGIPEFNKHLMSADFFNVTKFDSAYFKSKKVTKVSNNRAEVEGVLTLLGVSKPVKLDVMLNKIGSNPMTNQGKLIGLSATATIKRSEFGMSYALPGVSDEVQIEIQAELDMKK